MTEHVTIENIVTFLRKQKPVSSDYANYFAALEGMPPKRHYTSFSSMNDEDWSSVEYEGGGLWTTNN